MDTPSGGRVNYRVREQDNTREFLRHATKREPTKQRRRVKLCIVYAAVKGGSVILLFGLEEDRRTTHSRAPHRSGRAARQFPGEAAARADWGIRVQREELHVPFLYCSQRGLATDKHLGTEMLKTPCLSNPTSVNKKGEEVSKYLC